VEGEFDKPTTPVTPVPADAEPKPDRLGNGHMLMIGAALIGSGALMISVLSARGDNAAAAPSSAPSTASAPAKTAPAHSSSSVEASAGWIDNTDQWTPKTRRRVAFELAAVRDTQVWMKTVRPLLVVRCVQGEIESFVYTDSAATMEPQDDDHTVRLWFDEGNQQTERWPDSSAHDALFAPDGARFAAQLMQAKTVRFGYHPHNAAPVVAQFQVAGLRDKIDASPACRGKR
jgi:hypothetical protein